MGRDPRPLSLGSFAGSFVTLHVRPHRALLTTTLSGLTWVAPTLLLGLSAPAWVIAIGAFTAGTGLGVLGPL